ncbi:MAG: hypothetical protein HY951_12460 [Bacteroidia bacterium]|nr:hypothetical protein [Bacteroidia bacterium]
MKNFKRTILFLALSVFCITTFAQKNVVTFAPMGFVDKLRIKYERNLNENISAGAYINAYYMHFKGFRLDPIVRLYPTGSAPKGFYIQGKAVIGYFNSKMDYTYESVTDTLTISSQRSFPTYGAGLGIGYQFLVGGGEMPIDLFLGFQYSKFTAAQTIYIDGFEYTTLDDVLWYFTGPGSFLNANFGIGFSF